MVGSSVKSYFNYLSTGGGCHLSSLILTIFAQVVDVIFLVNYLCTGFQGHLSSLILTICAQSVVGGHLSSLYLSICAKVLGLWGHQCRHILSICAQVVGVICLVSSVHRW